MTKRSLWSNAGSRLIAMSDFAHHLDDDPGLAPPPAHWHKSRDVRSTTGLLLIVIAVGWLSGQIIAAVLLNEDVLAWMGIVP
jgi:hypothetical protein